MAASEVLWGFIWGGRVYVLRIMGGDDCNYVFVLIQQESAWTLNCAESKRDEKRD